MTAYENICFKIADLYRSDKILSYFKYDGISNDYDNLLCKMYSFNDIKLFITCDIALFRNSIKIEINYKGRMFEEDNRGKLSEEDYNKVVDLLTELLYSIGYEVLDNV